MKWHIIKFGNQVPTIIKHNHRIGLKESGKTNLKSQLGVGIIEGGRYPRENPEVIFVVRSGGKEKDDSCQLELTM